MSCQDTGFTLTWVSLNTQLISPKSKVYPVSLSLLDIPCCKYTTIPSLCVLQLLCSVHLSIFALKTSQHESNRALHPIRLAHGQLFLVCCRHSPHDGDEGLLIEHLEESNSLAPIMAAFISKYNACICALSKALSLLKF
jgi:hypothetical protein